MTNHTEDGLKRQVELETRMAALGTERFWQAIQSARDTHQEGQTNYGLQLLAHNIASVVHGIEAFLAEAKAGKPGRQHHAVSYLEKVPDLRVIALITLREMLQGASARPVLQRVAIAIGTRIEDEVRFTQFAVAKKKTFEKVRKQVSTASSYRHQRAVTILAANRAGVLMDTWNVSEKLHVGMKMIDIVIEATGLFEQVMIPTRKNRTNLHISATAALTEWVGKYTTRNESLTPVHLPCVIPPRPWSGPMNGGYHTDALPQLPLVKTSNRAYIEELSNRVDEMPVVYETINALQNTAWTINTEVLEVLRRLAEQGAEVEGIPKSTDIEFIPCPKCGEPLSLVKGGNREPHACLSANEEALKDWKKDAARAHAENNTRRGKRIGFARTLWVAEMFEPGEAIYMPYQIDFRGRIYAVPYLNPQGDDVMKGLLTFHEGKPITDGVAAGWLAIQGANTFGFDKASLEDRITWVEDRDDMILAVAEDPLSNRWWTEADKPWQFLAFCFEWAGFLREGYGYVSHLPVALDGSCSGIQHFSAMLRDSRGGKQVNLIPSDKPSDIYAEVCNLTVEKLRLDLSKGGMVFPDKGDDTPENAIPLDVLAQAILDLIPDRKMTKRQVMTLPYGATIFSCREYTEEWLKEQVKAGKPFPWNTKDSLQQWFYAAQYLSILIWDSIGEAVVAARSAMDWLQGVAKVVSAEGLPIVWTTPVGLPIQQMYPETTSRRVKTKLGDTQVYLTLRENLPTVDKARMKSSVSPNFVHSMDAAHLMWSVNYALTNEITSFAMIHDSFGTHAANADLLGRCLRQAFVDMYEEHDVLDEFREHIAAMLPVTKDELPKLPDKGDLNLQVVLSSDFFFA